LLSREAARLGQLRAFIDSEMDEENFDDDEEAMDGQKAGVDVAEDNFDDASESRSGCRRFDRMHRYLESPLSIRVQVHSTRLASEQVRAKTSDVFCD
jgi:hypothetical protein